MTMFNPNEVFILHNRYAPKYIMQSSFLPICFVSSSPSWKQMKLKDPSQSEQILSKHAEKNLHKFSFKEVWISTPSQIGPKLDSRFTTQKFPSELHLNTSLDTTCFKVHPLSCPSSLSHLNRTKRFSTWLLLQEERLPISRNSWRTQVSSLQMTSRLIEIKWFDIVFMYFILKFLIGSHLQRLENGYQ